MDEQALRRKLREIYMTGWRAEAEPSNQEIDDHADALMDEVVAAFKASR